LARAEGELRAGQPIEFEWTDIDGDGFKDGAGGVGKSGEIVVYRIMYPWHVITPFMGKLIGDHGVLKLVAYSVVKNEPY
jgi:hypothetical protein